ncbi:MAG: bifunctional (p)ppGpp synthetase/guanosine-3',5'-bis(diphosphate) 3'-pyrophosphohydrolase [Candidatus Izimaplasma sp.]|nr:bifunctional (p)ppGpp synthetase/guanosine-3',5'-bis(diphosphate) 3'-pyrophosphohydrolase [Candidatus Izimaplasma bacterium]
MIDPTIDKLLEKITYIKNKKHLKLIKDAFLYAEKFHKGQNRKSGEEYIVHPLNVGFILAEYQSDPETIIAGLLHDVIEDTDVTHEDISEKFSEEVAVVIEGVTKLGQYKYNGQNQEQQKLDVQAKNYQKMLLAMAQDIRVVIVKLADRLHNIRTLEALRPEKQLRIAKETMAIYAPLAHRLGMYVMKAELEDTCFKYINPTKYKRIARLIADKKHNRQADLNRMQEDLQDLLKENKLKSNIKGRIKNIYSVHKKMVDRKKDFEEIYDLLAVRIIVDNIEKCYRTIGIIHSNYTPIPNRFKDYIAMPKPNLYQSLHTSVISKGKIYEIQIRTEEMDHIAEYGVAAHWAYKETNAKQRKMTKEATQKLKWYGDLVEFTKESEDDSEVLNLLKDDIFQSNVYVFTPDGDIIDLPKGSTPIDFAFRIHTQVGLQTIGALVNQKIVPLDYQLETGDIVNIRTSKNSFGPNDNWLKIVKTSNAKSKIKNFLNKRRKESLIDIGKQDFQKQMRSENIKLTVTDDIVEELFSHKGAHTVEQLYYEIGKNTISPGHAINALRGNKIYTDEELIKKINKQAYFEADNEQNIVVEGLDNPSVKLSNCCSPIPGDDIIGFVTRGSGIAVHRKQCNNVQSFDKERLIKVHWGNKNDNRFVVNLKVIVENRDNVLGDIISAITTTDGKVNQVAASTQNNVEAIIKVKVAILSTKQLKDIIEKIQNVSGIYSIQRMMK